MPDNSPAMGLTEVVVGSWFLDSSFSQWGEWVKWTVLTRAVACSQLASFSKDLGSGCPVSTICRWESCLEHAAGWTVVAAQHDTACSRKGEWLKAGYMNSFDSGNPFFHLLLWPWAIWEHAVTILCSLAEDPMCLETSDLLWVYKRPRKTLQE